MSKSLAQVLCIAHITRNGQSVCVCVFPLHFENQNLGWQFKRSRSHLEKLCRQNNLRKERVDLHMTSKPVMESFWKLWTLPHFPGTIAILLMEKKSGNFELIWQISPFFERFYTSIPNRWVFLAGALVALVYHGTVATSAASITPGASGLSDFFLGGSYLEKPTPLKTNMSPKNGLFQ